jgi:hypothetical protein
MLLTKTMEEARPSRHPGELHNGTRYWRSDYFGSAKSAYDFPQAFYIEQSPDSVVPPHFHVVNQFQVVVGGGGTLGRHDLKPVAIHYSGEYTGYGPIIAEPQGLCYFTLRPNADSGAQFFPEARSRIKYTPNRRNVIGAGIDPIEPDALRALEEPHYRHLIEGYNDGLAAWLLRLGAGGRQELPGTEAGGCRYVVVTGGGLLHGEALLPEHSCLFLSADEPGLVLRAGAQGLEALVLQYPGGA